MFLLGLLKGYIIRYGIQLMVASIVILASLVVVFQYFGTGITIGIPTPPSWTLDLFIQITIGVFVSSIPALGLFAWYLRNNMYGLSDLDPRNGDLGGHLLSPKAWETLQVYALVDGELEQRDKDALHKIEVKKAKEAYECLRYYPKRNIAIISPAGESPSEIRRGYLNKLDFLLKKESLVSEKYDTLRQTVSSFIHDETQHRLNKYIHIVEGLTTPDNTSTQERIDERLSETSVDQLVEEKQEEIDAQVEEKYGVEKPDEPSLPDDLDTEQLGDSPGDDE